MVGAGVLDRNGSTHIELHFLVTVYQVTSGKQRYFAVVGAIKFINIIVSIFIYLVVFNYFKFLNASLYF